MEKKYSAFGGLFKMRISTSDENSKLDEEELGFLKEDYDKLKGELNDLKKIIDANSPESKKKHKTISEILNDSEIPYEVRMLHLIKAYRKDQEKWAKLAEYAKHLEAEVIRLKGILIDNGFTDIGASSDWTPDKEIASLKKKIKKLEDNIETKYPEKKQKIFRIKRVMSSQASYIVQLQYLLDKHGIPYLTPKPLKNLTQEDIDNIDENAVR